MHLLLKSGGSSEPKPSATVTEITEAEGAQAAAEGAGATPEIIPLATRTKEGMAELVKTLKNLPGQWLHFPPLLPPMKVVVHLTVIPAVSVLQENLLHLWSIAVAVAVLSDGHSERAVEQRSLWGRTRSADKEHEDGQMTTWRACRWREGCCGPSEAPGQHHRPGRQALHTRHPC